MEISQEQYSALKTKADKWDKLESDMSDLYQKLDDDDNDQGLDQIGELAASHLGFML